MNATSFRSSRLVLLTACCLLVVGAQALSAEHAKPNIVFIISDDHAWSDYGFMGHPHLKTPHLDKLAKESLAFSRGYVPSSLCCPSLATIMTGLYPHQHKVTSNDPPIPPGMTNGEFQKSKEFQAGRDTMNRHLEASPVLARELVKQGYLALQTGKWWQGHYRHGGFTHGMTQGGRHGDEGLTIGRKTMEPIYEFLGQAKREQKPFMVWYAPLMPHDPHTPPGRLFEKYEKLAPSPHVARYWAMVEWMDETVGELMARLEKEGLAENTIVVYLADNGWIQNPDSPKYAPRSKQSPYEGGVRTPILIRWPAKIAPHSSSGLAMSIDLAPTLYAALGMKPTAEMQGINLLEDAAVKARDTIYGECFTHNAVDLDRPAASLRWRWTIEGEWKLIVPAVNEPQGKIELFNVIADPREEKNLAADEPARVAKMTQKLDGWYKP